MKKKLDDVTWVLNQPVVSYTLKKHLLWCDKPKRWVVLPIDCLLPALYNMRVGKRHSCLYYSLYSIQSCFLPLVTTPTVQISTLMLFVALQQLCTRTTTRSIVTSTFLVVLAWTSSTILIWALASGSMQTCSNLALLATLDVSIEGRFVSLW